MILEKATKGSPATAGNTILTKSYWGLDLGVQATGGSPATAASAGGVGELLATVATKSNPATAGTETHYFHYDADGNVTETIDSNGDLTASYEYGPFGELISESWVYSTMNTYKFSTKPQDEETGYYYGFRYYDTNQGRWLSRDPLGEFYMSRSEFDSIIRYLKSLHRLAQSNIYAFIQNEALDNFDILGERTGKWKTYYTIKCSAISKKSCSEAVLGCPCTAGSQGDGSGIADNVDEAQSKARSNAESKAGPCGKGCVDNGTYDNADNGCEILDEFTIIEWN